MLTDVILAAADNSSALSDPLTYLTGLGFPGIVIGLLITGQLRTKAEVDRLIDELKRKDEVITTKDKQIEALQAGIVDKAIPALTRSTQVLEAIPKSDDNLFQQLAQAQQEIATLASRLERMSRGPSPRN